MKIFVFLLCILTANLSWGQKEVLNQQQIWYKYNLKLPISDQWQIRQELENRIFIDPSRQSQFLSRTMVQRKFQKGWGAALGFAYFVHSLPQEPEFQDHYNITELRPMFEITNNNQLNPKFNLNHRYRTDVRYFKQPGASYEFTNIRIRYKLELGYQWSSKFRFHIFDEVHFNLGNKITYSVFDQNRYGVAATYSPVKNVGLEIMYLNWFQQAAQGDLFYNRNIVRFTLHHTLGVFRQDGEKK